MRQRRSEAVTALAGAVATLAEAVEGLIRTLDRVRDDLKRLTDAITEEHWKPVQPWPRLRE